MRFYHAVIDQAERDGAKIFGKPNCVPKLAVVDYSKAVIKAVLHDFSGDCSTNSWTGHTWR